MHSKAVRELTKRFFCDLFIFLTRRYTKGVPFGVQKGLDLGVVPPLGEL